MAEKNNNKVPIQCPAHLINGVYANLGVVNFNLEEFILDFVFLHPNAKSGEIRSRVVLHPNHIRRLIKVLQKNIDDYDEQQSGQVDIDEDDQDLDEGFPPITLNLN